MSTPTPEDRLRAVEQRLYTLQAVADALEVAVAQAHQSGAHELGFNAGMLVERLRQELDATLALCTRRGGEVAP